MSDTHAFNISAHLPNELVGDSFRVTPVTSRVVRLEYSPSGRFEDRPSTFAVNRELILDAAEYQVSEYLGRLVLTTENFRLEYDRGPFSANGLKVEVLGGVSNYHSVWRYGQNLGLPADLQRASSGLKARQLDGNLGGAARTLDVADGEIPLEPGVNSRLGYSMIDDSTSMVFGADGSLTARGAEPGSLDLFVFAGGHDHVATMQDFYSLSGPQPLLPKFALGNWWSRYYRYTESEYLQLMDAFRAEHLPFSVAVIDMDWHLTNVDPKYGSGWTGYSWNRDLFPDPERFQRELHERGLAVTLNVHPADGVRAFEDAYEAMCERMGVPADGRALPFDVNNRDFLDAYFEVLHRGLEDQGTDFWWIDWQSGPYSSVKGVDPLWVLNHEHFVRSGRKLDRPLTFSRYAGPGSHRYPVGFSGDALITWESLQFQPRFTAAGANIGFGWWSHDIGGHMEGYRDNELTTRWLQFGTFSPILRLHSSNSPFSGKEPWKFPAPYGEIQAAHLRLRHRMLPYLHAMNYRAHHEGRALVEPVYFEEHSVAAYEHRDQYFFGSELLVAPITRPATKDVGRAGTEVFLPSGTWIDLFTETVYTGGGVQPMYRDLESIPVLVRGGGILPLSGDDVLAHVNENPSELDIVVAAGGAGEFVLHEEWAVPGGAGTDGTAPGAEAATGNAGESATGAGTVWSHTTLSVDPDAGEFRIHIPADTPEPAKAALEARTWNLGLLGHDGTAFGDVACEGGVVEQVEWADGAWPTTETLRPVQRVTAADTPALHASVLAVRDVAAGEDAVVSSAGFGTLKAHTEAGHADAAAKVIELVDRAEIGYALKGAVLDALGRGPQALLRELAGMGSAPSGHLPEVFEYEQPSPELIAAITELIG